MKHTAEVKVVDWREVRQGQTFNHRVPVYEWQGPKSGIGRIDGIDYRDFERYGPLPWPVRVLGDDLDWGYVFLARKDVGLGLISLLWALWWPVRAWLRVIRIRLWKTLHVWNLASTEMNTVPSWRSLHLCEPFHSWFKPKPAPAKSGGRK